jgi:hypothetical protein
VPFPKGLPAAAEAESAAAKLKPLPTRRALIIFDFQMRRLRYAHNERTYKL